eukprot:352041-Chlamydomonas_euryale.AAC.5
MNRGGPRGRGPAPVHTWSSVNPLSGRGHAFGAPPPPRGPSRGVPPDPRWGRPFPKCKPNSS